MPNAVVSDKFGHERIQNRRALGNRNIFLANVNGVQIVSTLNPYAVEFYPMHIREQLRNRGDFNFERQVQQRDLQYQLQSEETEEQRQQQAQDHLEGQKDLTNDQTCSTDNLNTHVNDDIKQNDQVIDEKNFEKPEGFENEKSAKLQISIEDISDDLISEIKEEIGYFHLPQKCMKIVEIIAIEEITDETISKPQVNINKNTKEKTVANNAMLDAKRLFFGSDLEVENNASDEVSNLLRDSEKVSTDETAKSTNLKSNSEEIKYNTNIEDVGDHNHAYESDTDVLLQINKVSRSQTDIKPRMNVEILDGKAPPTTPRNDVYLHNQLLMQKGKYLSPEDPKKRKSPITSRYNGKPATGSGITRKLPEKTTCREPTVSSTIKERQRITSTNRVKQLLEPKKIETTRQKLPNSTTDKTCMLQCQTSTSSTTTSRSTCRHLHPTSSDCIKNRKTPAIVISRPVTPSVPRSSVSQKSLKNTDCRSSSILKTREPVIRTSYSAASTSVCKSNNATQSK